MFDCFINLAFRLLKHMSHFLLNLKSQFENDFRFAVCLCLCEFWLNLIWIMRHETFKLLMHCRFDHVHRLVIIATRSLSRSHSSKCICTMSVSTSIKIVKHFQSNELWHFCDRSIELNVVRLLTDWFIYPTFCACVCVSFSYLDSSYSPTIYCSVFSVSETFHVQKIELEL